MFTSRLETWCGCSSLRRQAHHEVGPPVGGPAKIGQSAGFDNWEVVRDDTDEHSIVHCSFLVSSQCPSDSLGTIAERIVAEVELEDENGTLRENDDGAECDAARRHEGGALYEWIHRSGRRPGDSKLGCRSNDGADGGCHREVAERTGRRATDGVTGGAREPAPTSANLILQDATEKLRAPLDGATARSKADETTRVLGVGMSSSRNTAKAALPGISAPAVNDAGGARMSMTVQPKPPCRTEDASGRRMRMWMPKPPKKAGISGDKRPAHEKHAQQDGKLHATNRKHQRRRRHD
ncbi:hypothetical protein PR003_g24799 [Phytophthora rubi]|uniref:Uncharacterized protein n=1 Tax=Phytophthora rubi TaxID=129364 RepID=A0A6A3IN45_9STRA|nr:hypothetical protein PR001_g23196 [Phytophthora rubi]KAE9018500.1 hypothetical protein PR002_g13079 [Phytophthora rubi]KAE9292277.1 hypothetical protein PR003_g24799 [Phytophthora rubi]